MMMTVMMRALDYDLAGRTTAKCSLACFDLVAWKEEREKEREKESVEIGRAHV